VLCCGLEMNGMVGEWHGRGMASVNQTRPPCVNQMGKTHSKPLAARYGRRTAWARHAMCESAFTCRHGATCRRSLVLTTKRLPMDERATKINRVCTLDPVMIC